jgi:two-component system sensor histidine kinase/response regulator
MHSIVVIEDEPNILANTLDILRFEGFDAHGAENGRKGIDLAREQRPDLILCDIMMPECDGYTVLSEVRSDDEMKSIPLVMMSAKVDQATLREVVAMGASDYLAKPFTMPELMTVIRRCLDE